MRNTSESPDANEQVQAKPATTKSRAGTRSKTESALLSTPEKPESPEQDTKPAARRRTTSATTTKGASEPAAQHATDTAATPSDTTTRPSRPAAAQRTSTTRKAAATPAAQPEVPTPAEATTRTTPAQRTGGATRSPGQSQPNSGPTTTPTPIQRGNAAGTPAQRPAQAGAPGQRSSQSGAPTYRPTGPGAPAQRPPAGTPPRSNSVGGAPAQQATHYPNTQARPVNRQGGTQTAPNRPGAAIRPGAPRPGAPRPAAPGHPASARPGARPATPAQRSQERRAAAVKEKVTGPVSIPPQIVVKDLAELLHTTPNEIIRGLIKHSIFANINQIVEYEKAALVAEELGFEPSLSTITTAPAVQSDRGLSANEAMMATRNDDDMVVIPPVVTIMGHVDHGKTSLLDMIRKTKVAAGEAGGITQYIGAYQVEVNGKKITFLDTPGHEAFTAMRARGAQVTHIAVIVVAADDGVMPQTREAIDHARAAKVPIIIALNKIDKANANPDLVKQQLAEIGVVIEEYGGDVVCVPVSARRGTGIDDLLEMILLVAEVQDIKANPNRPATGVIIEAKLEKNTGPTATVLIQQGTLKMGDNVVVKCDVQGTAEAIKNALTKVGEENIKVRLIHEGIGNINETDVHLASASGAIIIGFNVKADGAALRLAQKEGVDIRYYDVIYKLIDDIQAALTGMLEPTYREVIEGHAEVMQIFKAGKNTVIAGCRITDGKITRSSQARILRRNATGIVYDGKIASLRRGKDDVREVATGYECGIVLDDFTDFEIGDIIEAYSKERVKTGA